MSEAEDYQQKRVGEGRSIFVKDETASLLKALRAAAPEDVAVEGGLPEIGFLHRRAGDHDIYFLANFTTQERNIRASFRAGDRTPEFWDPMTGKIGVAPDFSYAGNRTAVNVSLEPYGSTFVVFGSARGKPPAPRLSTAPTQTPAPLVVGGPWKLSWTGSTAKPVEISALKSGTEFPTTRYFSGRGTYQTTIRVPATYFHPGTRLLLEMGDVKNTAEVWINGRHAGVAWKIPYRLDVTSYLKPGANTLRIDVTNLLINLVLSQPVKDYSEVEARYGTRIPKPREKEFHKEPLPSGLLGPIVIEQTACGPNGGDCCLHPAALGKILDPSH
jgi:hypothetical protein